MAEHHRSWRALPPTDKQLSRFRSLGVAEWLLAIIDRGRAADLARMITRRRLRDPKVTMRKLRSLNVDTAWHTSAVRGLARSIHADQAYDRLPILADALEEAGCHDAAMLASLRAGTDTYGVVFSIIDRSPGHAS